ncbi:indolepyruvate ferredoxin oxidoreductase family protein [Paenalcaligenes niemegkensis]|nr:indolepyruvate ferredoxin oxidoreductase family protein [Paenalcaligenes niemegkensis]MCQ9615427.1 indolepyruvate ferredoxin oxidoreductase family protein [Paenalcaligenes niemegkensis]
MMTRTLNRHYTLSDNLNATQGRVFLNGTQALVRLLLSQQRLDKQAGLNTAGFVSGYRGSPLGGVDTALWKASDQLDAAGITFQPAINEDLAATMLMGTQQAGIRSDRNVDGVFAMWYGKGPGLDRAGDAIHHGHAAGASKQGGVLMIVGDDHIAASSSIPHASENALRNWRIPTINPASVEEYEYFGLWGWALSRYSGAWVAFKAVTETIESGRSFEVEPLPHFEASRHDRHKGSLEYDASKFLSPDIELQIENRIRAVREFARQFPLERYLRNDAGAKIGIVSTGKATLDVCDALEELCRESPHPPLKHLKIGLIWPLDENAIRAFAKDLDHILVVEEKGAFIETQIKELLFNDEIRPSIAGKTLNGTELIPSAGQLCPSLMKKALQRWWQKDKATSLFSSRTAQEAEINTEGLSRRPYFCSGCPHNSSTKVPEGSQALGGVGCHYMATSMSRNTQGLTQMGGEGTDWIGLSPYTKTPHIFQNMGEGTYFHSGYLAIRQAVSAKANITYKILFNDAVAMTGGQPVDGPISVPRICQQVMGEGVERVVITTDEPERYRGVLLPDGITVHHRRELDALQRELRDIKGVTVLIHDQSCAAEKRRRRKQKSYSDPAHRLFINTEVCEGCGDCGTQSNCLSLVPEETSLGRKRAIEQSSCNKDYSCVDGFCPSFVSVIGGLPRKRASASVALLREEMLQRFAELGPPQPAAQTASDPCNVLVAGIGGTGVITVGAVLAMAAHLEGRHASIMDMTGLAQKGAR